MTIDSVLEHLKPREIVYLLVAAAAVLAIVLIIALKGLGGLLSRFGLIKIGPVQLHEADDKSDKHINSVKFLMVLSKQAEYINQRRDIKNSIMPDQMRYAESVSVEIRGMLLKAFASAARSEMENRGCESGNDSDDYHMYRLCIRIMHEDMREWMREAFRENHFSEKTQIDFDRYVATKIADGLQVAAEVLDDLYRGKTISRSRISHENEKIMGELKTKIESIFREARRVSIDAEAAIERARIDYEAFLAEATKESL